MAIKYLSTKTPRLLKIFVQNRILIRPGTLFIPDTNLYVGRFEHKSDLIVLQTNYTARIACYPSSEFKFTVGDYRTVDNTLTRIS